MKVTISVAGRFHAFYLAKELLDRGYLCKLITSYPKFEVARYGVPRSKTDSLIIRELLERSWNKLPIQIKDLYNAKFAIADLYDKLAESHIEKSDIFIGWAHRALRCMRRAKSQGAITILQKTCAHPFFQERILKEEFDKFGMKFRGLHPKVIEKELIEYQECDYIEVPSSFVKKTFLDQGFDEKKIIQGFRGVDINEFSTIPKQDNVFRIIYSGNMTLQKGVHYLLQAFSELNLPNSELLLMGIFRDEIKPFFKKYEGKFRWIGHLPQRQLYKYYSQGSVAVQNSIQDGFPVVMCQAMACGLPLICTTNTGTIDLINTSKCGFVIPIRSVEALKEKLTFLYENEKIREEMGQIAMREIREKWTWSHYGEHIINIYKEILQNK